MTEGNGGAVIVLLIALYLLPTLIALLRFRRNLVAIAALNLLLGWSLIGWVIALVWALSSSETAPPPARAAAPDTRNLKACPACAEMIQKAARKCRFCGEAV